MRRREISKGDQEGNDQGSWRNIKEMGCWHESGVKISHMFSPAHPLVECRAVQGPRGGQSNEVWRAWSLDDSMKSRPSLPTWTVMRSRCNIVLFGLWDLGIFLNSCWPTLPWLTQELMPFERCQHLILRALANFNCWYPHECYSLLMSH